MSSTVGEEEYVLSERGAYRWNAAILVQSDVDLFKQLCSKAKNSKETQLAKLHYEEAVWLYKGEFLGRYGNESWMIPLTTYYHSMFLSRETLINSINSA